MKYSWFELLTMGVGVCAVIGTSIATLSGANMGPEIVGQALILVALWGGLHYGLKGAVVSFIISTSIYAIVLFSFMSGQLSIALELFLFRTGVYGAVAFAAGELNTRLRYLFVKLEHHDYIDDVTNLYNAKYFAKLLENKINEFDRYGLKFSLASFAIREDLFSPLKQKARNKLIKEIGNSVVRGNIRGVDEAAHTADKEFMLLFPNTNLDGAAIATNRVSGKIRGYLDHHGLDTDSEDTIETEILEYPPDRAGIEELAAGLSETAPG
ncbi:MAG: diguanylate cyclase [Actinobacteria bacterium]|nr:diguanylate cyclase [Actinomycetota bacterium]